MDVQFFSSWAVSKQVEECEYAETMVEGDHWDASEEEDSPV
jgi:hypothetical protein